MLRSLEISRTRQHPANVANKHKRHSMMTPNQARLIQSSWNMIEPIIDTAAVLFYNRLFEIDPTVKPLFANSDMNQQRDKLLDTLNLAVQNVDQIEHMAESLADLGKRHANYGVEDQHYETVRAALLWALGQGLGDLFTPEVRDAWNACYQAIADPMRQHT